MKSVKAIIMCEIKTGEAKLFPEPHTYRLYDFKQAERLEPIWNTYGFTGKTVRITEIKRKGGK